MNRTQRKRQIVAFSMMGGTGRMRTFPRSGMSKTEVRRAFAKEFGLRKQAEADRDKAAQRALEAQGNLARTMAEAARATVSAKFKRGVDSIKRFLTRRVF